MNKSILFFLILFAHLHTKEHTYECHKKAFKQGFLPTARPCYRNCCSGKWGVIINASLIIWQAKEDYLEYAAKNFLLNTNALNINAKNEFPKFDFRAGFKFGLGFFTPKNDIDLFANYTYYHSNNKTSVSAPTSIDGFGIIPLWRHPVSVPVSTLRYRNASSRWRLTFNTLDLELGYSMMVSKHLDLRFNGGLKGININQEYDVLYENGQIINNIEPLFGKVHLKNDGRGLGPRIGFQSKWRLNSNFHIYSSNAISLVLGEYDVRRNELDIAIDIPIAEQIITDINFTEKPWIWKPIAENILGIGWQCCYKCFSINADISYEIQYFYEQNLLRRFTDSFNESLNVPLKGDLTLHGINFKLRFDF
jgi:Legionella pneumophila major outer membrane protein precursor